MFRAILLALSALAASACSYGSAVNVAPFKARASSAIVADGDYCEVTGQWAPFMVNSSDDCIPVRWNGARRLYLVSVEDDDTLEAAVAPLGGGLYAAQIDVAKGPAPHQIHLLISKGNAFAMLRVLDDTELKAVGRRHPKVTFAADNGRPYVAAGKLGDVKTWLKDIAREALKIANAEGEQLSVGVRDMGETADHAASKTQTKDIEAVIKIAKKLAAE